MTLFNIFIYQSKNILVDNSFMEKHAHTHIPVLLAMQWQES